MKYYHNQLALITGGSSGIGLALAKKMATRGANVYILARRSELLLAAKTQIEGARFSKTQVIGTLQADITNLEEISQKLSQFQSEVGVPDILINAAGITQPGYVEDLGMDVFRRLIDTNYLGSVAVTKAFLKGMMERHSGLIINITSVLGHCATYGYSAYSGSKFALRGFSDSLRAEMKPFGIRVAVVFPADTQTPGLEEERKVQPIEAQIVNNGGGLFSPETIADDTLKGVEHGRYLILPGFENKIIYMLSSLNLFYPTVDLMIKSALKKSGRIEKAKAGH